MTVEIVTRTKRRVIEEALSCSAPGVLGYFQILPNHTAFISELSVGEVKVQTAERTYLYAESGGFLEVVDNKVLLLLEAAEAAEEIDVERAMKAKERAEQRLQNPDASIDIARAQAALARALNRLKVAEKVTVSV
ncbi:MAG: F0F1 ATP synthase subunit epsilon [Calditrichaeota bacterium]|nr:MAG: F0F1 ATP synthase subunit epsilon [Calditrichota bacterium]